VKKRDGIPGSSPRTGQPTDRGIPVTGHGATRPRGLDQTSIHATPQGLRPRAAPPGRTHDRNWSSMQTRGKILASRGPSTHDPGMRPPSRTLRQVASSHRYGHSPSIGRSRKALTRSSMSPACAGAGSCTASRLGSLKCRKAPSPAPACRPVGSTRRQSRPPGSP